MWVLPEESEVFWTLSLKKNADDFKECVSAIQIFSAVNFTDLWSNIFHICFMQHAVMLHECNVV